MTGIGGVGDIPGAMSSPRRRTAAHKGQSAAFHANHGARYPCAGPPIPKNNRKMLPTQDSFQNPTDRIQHSQAINPDFSYAAPLGGADDRHVRIAMFGSRVRLLAQVLPWLRCSPIRILFTLNGARKSEIQRIRLDWCWNENRRFLADWGGIWRKCSRMGGPAAMPAWKQCAVGLSGLWHRQRNTRHLSCCKGVMNRGSPATDTNNRTQHRFQKGNTCHAQVVPNQGKPADNTARSTRPCHRMAMFKTLFTLPCCQSQLNRSGSLGGDVRWPRGGRNSCAW